MDATTAASNGMAAEPIDETRARSTRERDPQAILDGIASGVGIATDIADTFIGIRNPSSTTPTTPTGGTYYPPYTLPPVEQSWFKKNKTLAIGGVLGVLLLGVAAFFILKK